MAQTKKRSRKKNKKTMILALIVVLTVAVGAAVYTYFYGAVSASSDTVSVSIPTGSSLDDIATKLVDNHLVRSKNAFKIYVKLQNKQSELKAGRYTFTADTNTSAIVQKLIEGQVADTVIITVKEGLDLNRISLYLQDAGLFSQQEFLDEIKNNFDYYKAKYAFLASVPEDREYKLEGYLFGDTYEVYKDATPREVIEKMLDRFGDKFKDEYYARCEERGITVDEAVTMASVVEREGILDSELPVIAGVFYNRLKDDMLLQSCATLQYIYKDYQFSFSAAQMKVDNPYNTYKYAGLPAGPISNFRETALIAALYPEDTDYYYFVTKNDGTGASAFAKTLSEHENNIDKYSGNWD